MANKPMKLDMKKAVKVGTKADPKPKAMTQKEILAAVEKKQSEIETKINSLKEVTNWIGQNVTALHEKLDKELVEVTTTRKIVMDLRTENSKHVEKSNWFDCLVQPVLVFAITATILFGLSNFKGCDKMPLPNPIPTPGPGPNPEPDEAIYVDSQIDLNIVKGAIDIVSRNWEQGRYNNELSDAMVDLDGLLGGPKNAIPQGVQEAVINEFTGGKPFEECTKTVLSKLKLKGPR